jgi:hypothetical protein
MPGPLFFAYRIRYNSLMKKLIKGLICKLRGHKTRIAQCPVTGIKVLKCDVCKIGSHNSSKGMSFS